MSTKDFLIGRSKMLNEYYDLGRHLWWLRVGLRPSKCVIEKKILRYKPLEPKHETGNEIDRLNRYLEDQLKRTLKARDNGDAKLY